MSVNLTGQYTRECGECAMCCHLPEIPALEKPAGTWCVHCPSHHGCAAYDVRPEPCRAFNCTYILNTNLGEEWRPTTAHFLMTQHDGQLIVMVEPEHPDAWRREPYFTAFQQWKSQVYVIICVGMHKRILFADHECDLGISERGDQIEFIGIPLAEGGIRVSAQLRKAAGGAA